MCIMQVERGSFLLLVSSLAAGGAAGYLLSEKDAVPHLGDSAHNPKPVTMVQVPESAVMELPATPVGQTEITSANAEKKPACDDFRRKKAVAGRSRTSAARTSRRR
jgi:hypothetical protein